MAVLLPIYFRDKNLSRGQVMYRQNQGQILPLARGVYLGSPAQHKALRGASAEQIAEAVNRSLRAFAVRIASHLYPDSVIGWAGAFRMKPDEENRLVIYSRGRAGITEIGGELKNHLPPEVAGLIRPIHIERRRIRNEEQMRYGTDYEPHRFDDGLEKIPGIWDYLGQSDTPQLPTMIGWATTPRRTLLDVMRHQGEPGSFMAETDIKALALHADMPTGGKNMPARVRAALEALRQEFPFMPEAVFNRLGDQLLRLFQSQSATKPAGMDKARFQLRWHGMRVGHLICRHDDRWFFYYEPGWGLKLWDEPAGEMFPPFISSLFPEQRTFNPSERAEFLRQYSRLMSNLTIVEDNASAPPIQEDRLTQTLQEAAPDGPLFEGSVEGLPAYDRRFLTKAQQIMAHSAITQISGAQIKVPMGLEEGVLRTAENCAFTHIMKMPMDNRMRALPLYEWLAMSLIKCAGVEVPEFRLVPLGRIDGKEDDLASQQKNAGLPVMSDIIDKLAHAPNAPEGESEGLRRLSEALANREESSPIPDASAWDEMLRLSALNMGELFKPLSEEQLAQNAPPAYLVERFDIPTRTDPRWRLAEDFCALTGRISDVSSEAKYSGSMEEVALALKQHSTNWEEDSRRLFRQVVGNILVCNNDAHLKNFSVLRIAKPGHNAFDEVRLSPAYDVTVTAVITNGVMRQALPMYGERNPDRELLLHYAQEACGIPATEAEAIIDQMAMAMEASLPSLMASLPKEVRADRGLWENLEQAGRYVQTACRKVSRACAPKNKMVAPGLGR